MRALDSAEILRVWELGQDRPNWQRALLLLAPCFPELRPSALAAWTLARRNRLLLALRAATIGPALEGLVRCPACGAPLEFSITVRELLENDSVQEPETGTMTKEDVTWRLPTTHDLAAAARALELSEAALTLWRRSAAISAAGPPAEAAAVHAVEATIGERHPLVDIRIPLRCAEQEEHVWSASLDLAAFLWIEIDRIAKRLLDDVQALARGYGWREADILAMSEGRRQVYLEALAG